MSVKDCDRIAEYHIANLKDHTSMEPMYAIALLSYVKVRV